MRIQAFLLAAIGTAVPVTAAETAWQDIAPEVAIRLISTGVVSLSGTTLMALEIDMPAGTKTYWRVPGETGLPLELDLSASSGIGRHLNHWPYPTREEKFGYLDFVYYGRTVLPIEIEVLDPAGQLEVSATLGVCSDICIPANASFSLPLVDLAADRLNGLRIKQALSEVPIAWESSDQPVGVVTVEADIGALAVEVESGAIEVGSLIAATQDGQTLFGTPQKSPQPGLVLLPILGKSDNSALDGQEVELTFQTDRGAYVVERTIGEEPATAAVED